jgi:hypothetical protein
LVVVTEENKTDVIKDGRFEVLGRERERDMQ